MKTKESIFRTVDKGRPKKSNPKQDCYLPVVGHLKIYLKH